MPTGFPPLPVFPFGIDSDYTLYLVYNTSEAPLTANNEAWAEEVPVKPRKPGQTEIWADNGFATISGEMFYYDAVEKDSNGYVKTLKRCIRNLGGQDTKANLAGTMVRGFVMAEHHNQLVEALVRIENFVGENFSADQQTLDWRIRNLRAVPLIFDDFDCPDVNFTFNITENDPASGILANYTVEVVGNYTNFTLDFGDGTFTKSVANGEHRYAPNANVDPVITIGNEKCQLVQSPIARAATATPEQTPEENVIELPIPTCPDIGDIFIPNISIPPTDIQIPPLVFPCVDVSPFPSTFFGPISIAVDFTPIGIPSMISFTPLLNIPSVITFTPLLSIPNFISINSPSLIVPEIPNISLVGPSIPNIISIVGPSIPNIISLVGLSIPNTISMYGPDIPDTISFVGPTPSIPPTITITGPNPSIPPTISLVGPSPSLPERISIIGPSIPTEIEIIGMSIPPTITITGPNPSLPETISIVGPSPSLPEFISLVGMSIPEKISLVGMSIPEKISLVGMSIPEQISIVGSIPEKISLVGMSIPSEISFVGCCDIPTEISVLVPSLPKFEIDIPSLPKFEIDVPSFPKIQIDVPSIPNISLIVPQIPNINLIVPQIPNIFLIVPSLPNISLVVPSFQCISMCIPSFPYISVAFPTVPAIPVNWGTVPAVPINVTVTCNCACCPSAMAMNFAEPEFNDQFNPFAQQQSWMQPEEMEINYDFQGFPSIISIESPVLPDVKIVHDLPASIDLLAPEKMLIEYVGPPLPSEIRLIAPTDPVQLQYAGPSVIKLDASGLGAGIPLLPPEKLPMIAIDASTIPSTIQVVGVPSVIEIVHTIPSVVHLVVPSDMTVRMLPPTEAVPVSVMLTLNVDGIQKIIQEQEQQIQCVAIVPCPPR